MSDDFQPSEAAQTRPSRWAAERMNWEAERIASKTSPEISKSRPISWLLAARRVRRIVTEIAFAIASIAWAGCACGICYAIWQIIYNVVQRVAK